MIIYVVARKMLKRIALSWISGWLSCMGITSWEEKGKIMVNANYDMFDLYLELVYDLYHYIVGTWYDDVDVVICDGDECIYGSTGDGAWIELANMLEAEEEYEEA